MIPTIEQICEDLKAGTITVQQAISWLHQHAAGAANDLRDHFAAQALVECIRVAADQTPLAPGAPAPVLTELFDKAAAYSYYAADAMLTAREIS